MDRRRFEGRSLTGRLWQWRLSDKTPTATAPPSQLSPLVSRLLAGRGITADEANHFLNPRLRDTLPPPARFADMEQAASRICAAISDSAAVAILADSDADGSSAAALMYRYLRALGCDVRVCVPDRFRDGYGPNESLIKELIADGCDLLITLDCGTTAHDPLALAQKSGIDVIVCDHHLPDASLPEVHSVVNPCRRDDESGQQTLTGVGVAFMLALAVNLRLRDTEGRAPESLPDPLKLTDLVALGTVCDMGELRGLNRAFVYQGLRNLRRGGNLGMTALRRRLGGDDGWSAETLGFYVGPCINAGARMGEGELAHRLLIEEDEVQARDLAARLYEHNCERREREAMVLRAAVTAAEAGDLSDGVLVVSGDDWHRGVLGIVAGRLARRFHLPSVVLSAGDDGLLHGSGRSVAGLDLGSAVLEARSAGLLESGGGHAMAVGLSLKRAMVDEFREFLSSRFRGEVVALEAARVLELDDILLPAAVGDGVMGEVERLHPYGVGNPEPCFAVEGLVVERSWEIRGGGYGVKFRDSLGTRLRGVSFRSAGTNLGMALLDEGGRALDVAVRLRREEYGVGLVLEDIRWSGG